MRADGRLRSLWPCPRRRRFIEIHLRQHFPSEERVRSTRTIFVGHAFRLVVRAIRDRAGFEQAVPPGKRRKRIRISCLARRHAFRFRYAQRFVRDAPHRWRRHLEAHAFGKQTVWNRIQGRRRDVLLFVLAAIGRRRIGRAGLSDLEDDEKTGRRDDEQPGLSSAKRMEVRSCRLVSPSSCRPFVGGTASGRASTEGGPRSTQSTPRRNRQSRGRTEASPSGASEGAGRRDAAKEAVFW